MYDWSQFEISMYFARPREELFRVWATARGLESFFIQTAEHSSPDGEVRARDEVVHSGDSYRWKYVHDFRGQGTFTRVDPNERVQFTFGHMTVDVTFRDVDDGTEVHLHQSGCAIDDPDRAWQHLNCRSCWVYFLTNLRAVLHQGIDLRDHEHPDRNDSVSIGWDRKRVATV
ncbi:MAG: SRPBCC domain-containing protein [Candidatus Eisenbacteria bacterium]|uniref:SRPBCC domain-containing protein n=1 Tax=Eiseniibacteriota bacterium TaxID=2212470 RepID=A0A956NEQ9_UNCEI|nr:SRPBCC domain-containing protein [Candidatus Eisenbacteria bacterium]